MRQNDGSDLIAFSNPMDVTRIQYGVPISFPQSNFSLLAIEGLPPFISVLFSIVATIVVSSVITIAIGIIHNSIYPVIAREALVVAKRHTCGKNSSQARQPHSDNLPQSYYVTFEFVGGARQEFRISGKDYDGLPEGEPGILHSQGTWFRGFDY
jgi:hypothetical protein